MKGHIKVDPGEIRMRCPIKVSFFKRDLKDDTHFFSVMFAAVLHFVVLSFPMFVCLERCSIICLGSFPT